MRALGIYRVVLLYGDSRSVAMTHGLRLTWKEFIVRQSRVGREACRVGTGAETSASWAWMNARWVVNSCTGTSGIFRVCYVGGELCATRSYP